MNNTVKIYVGFGANLVLNGFFDLKSSLEHVINYIKSCPQIKIEKISPIYRSQPIPISDQPWYLNGVFSCNSKLNADDFMQFLHDVEKYFGRVREKKNQSRVLDLDLISYGQDIYEKENLHVPHPRLADRLFVLLPLKDIAPQWRHPITDQGLDDMLAPHCDQKIERLDEPFVV